MLISILQRLRKCLTHILLAAAILFTVAGFRAKGLNRSGSNKPVEGLGRQVCVRVWGFEVGKRGGELSVHLKASARNQGYEP